MSAKYKINLSTINSTTATTINIPIIMEYQIIDNSELVETVFVDTQIQESVNPILDYEKVRFKPVNLSNINIDNVNYNLFFLQSGTIKVPTYYSDIAITDTDISSENNYFTNSYLYLEFFDSDNPLTQNLVNQVEIYSMLLPNSYYPKGTPKMAGKPKSASAIPVSFTVSNPLTVPKAFYEGYHIYDYKDEYVIGTSNYLYVKASYFNAKTGTFTNLMTDNNKYSINDLINKLYIRYQLYRDTTGFYYKIDNTYSNNIIYNSNTVSVNLYEIQSL